MITNNQDNFIKLNEFNKQFYTKFAESFDNSRKTAWNGWHVLAPEIKVALEKSQSKAVLDLGCGNGRFLKFLAETLKKPFTYHGLDLSKPLLAHAQDLARSLSLTQNSHFVLQDLVSVVAGREELETTLQGCSYAVVVLFGVLHHIPEFELRRKLLELAVDRLELGGILIVTFWQFDKTEGKKLKAGATTNSTNVNSADQFAENDHLLGWHTQDKARYAHHFCDKEIALLTSNLPDTHQITCFNADGKNWSNQYLVLKKTAKRV